MISITINITNNYLKIMIINCFRKTNYFRKIIMIIITITNYFLIYED
jgi:hypothetical protein